jgi:hypothetical protein
LLAALGFLLLGSLAWLGYCFLKAKPVK